MKKMIIITLITLVIITSGCIGQEDNGSNIYQKDYFDYTHNFRANLTEAGRIPIFPSDDEVAKVVLHSNLSKVRVAFIPYDEESMEGAYIKVAAIEISIKLTNTYKEYYGYALPIEPLQVSSREEAVTISNKNEPVVLILGPTHSNKTAVRKYSDHVLIAEGASIPEKAGPYSEIDLAVDKLLLAVMNRAQDIILLSTTGEMNAEPEILMPGEGYVPLSELK